MEHTRTAQAVDRELMEARSRYLFAVDIDDVNLAVQAYDDLDRLLDERIHLPQQATA